MKLHNGFDGVIRGMYVTSEGAVGDVPDVRDEVETALKVVEYSFEEHFTEIKGRRNIVPCGWEHPHVPHYIDRGEWDVCPGIEENLLEIQGVQKSRWVTVRLRNTEDE